MSSHNINQIIGNIKEEIRYRFEGNPEEIKILIDLIDKEIERENGNNKEA